MSVTYDELHQRLKEERERLTKELEQLVADAPSSGEGKEGSPFGKKEEGAAEVLELEKRLVLKERLRQALSEVEHTLSKFDQGSYGLCDVCGQPIGQERLEVLPQANLCVQCKGQQAKNAKGRFPAR